MDGKEEVVEQSENKNEQDSGLHEDSARGDISQKTQKAQNLNQEQKKEVTEESEKKQASDEPTKKSSANKIFLYTFLVILAGFLLMITVPKFIPRAASLTIEDLHRQNLEGKLSHDKGFLYKGIYSFVFYDGLWHTQLKSPGGTELYDIHFHFSPKEVEHITPLGILNYSALQDFESFYMTFDPLDEGLSYIAVSTGEIVFPLTRAFGKKVIAACIRNETAACFDRPIIDCNSTSAPVFYFASEDETNILYMNNCVVISGTGEELFKATDRVLYDLLNII